MCLFREKEGLNIYGVACVSFFLLLLLFFGGGGGGGGGGGVDCFSPERVY